MHNFLPARDLLLGAGAAESLADGAALGSAVAQLLGDPVRRQAMGRSAGEAVLANRGALQRLLHQLDQP
jgi:3-deoxy-D-manno-octulosonic-acid transferase